MQLSLLDVSGKETANKAEIQWIEIEKLYPHPDNPRLIYKEEIITAIATSIEKDGFQPCYALLVRPFEDGYQILSGHTRLKASQQVGVKKLPCWVKEIYCVFIFLYNQCISTPTTTPSRSFSIYGRNIASTV